MSCKKQDDFRPVKMLRTFDKIVELVKEQLGEKLNYFYIFNRYRTLFQEKKLFYIALLKVNLDF